MERGRSLTISLVNPAFGLIGLTVLGSLFLAACSDITIGPPKETDPPLVPQAAKAPPAPAQPVEPQAWTKDLNLGAGPTKIDRKSLANGLVGSTTPEIYSGQHLTYESAFSDERPVTQAEQSLKRARERAKAAGAVPPPEVAAAPVEQVTEDALGPLRSEAAGKSKRRESLLPPPPKFPPLPAKTGQTAANETAPASATPAAEAASATAEPKPAKRQSMLPPPPKFPPVPPETGQAAANTAAPVSDTPAPEAVQKEPVATAEAVPAETEPMPAKRQSMLPPPPKFPPLPAKTGQAAANAAASVPDTSAPKAASEEPAATAEAAPAGSEPTATEAAPPTPEAASATAETPPDAAAASFLADAWEAPAGTILVQVAAVQNKADVLKEWLGLQRRYAPVLKALRLVIDEAKLGDRGVFYRVQAGAFTSQEGAKQACKVLIDQGQACFVVVR